MSMPSREDLVELARSLVREEGREPEYLSVVERTWDFLEEKGHNLDLLTEEELDALYEQVRVLCIKSFEE